MLYEADVSIDWDGAHVPDAEELVGSHPDKVFYMVRDSQVGRMALNLVAAIREYRYADSVVPCSDLSEVTRWLTERTYVSDREQFGAGDVWMHPADFERTGRGDCDDHALWAYSKLAQLGYAVRYMVGRSDSIGHAWVMLREDDRWLIVETTQKSAGRALAWRYEPEWSVDHELRFYDHRRSVDGVRWDGTPGDGKSGG